MQQKIFYVYMMAGIKGALYTGMTRDIASQVEQHRTGIGPVFSSKYRTTNLVCCEVAETFESAREREAQLKRWRSSKKVALIELANPYWEDISYRLG
jgi:putative endonuclease